MIDVYRLEHVGCAGQNPNHGPFMTSGCSDRELPYGTRRLKPQFGFAGRKPILENTGQVCAVTARQARYWWGHGVPSREELYEYIASGWEFVHYRVSECDAYESRGQIVFTLESAERVGPVGFPRHLRTDRRTTPDSRYRFHDRESHHDRVPVGV